MAPSLNDKADDRFGGPGWVPMPFVAILQHETGFRNTRFWQVAAGLLPHWWDTGSSAEGEEGFEECGEGEEMDEGVEGSQQQGRSGTVFSLFLPFEAVSRRAV